MTTVSDIKQDGILVPAGEVRWLAKNVFTVSVDIYRRVVSCELSAVDIPRGTAPALERAIEFVLSHVRAASHRLLLQEHYASFPLQAYGDIIFWSGDQWVSMQEALLQLGVARIIRPVVSRLRELIGSELCAVGEPLLPSASSWAARLLQFESTHTFRAMASGQVVDVLRGDAYIVRWDPSCPEGPSLPPLVLLDAVTSHGVRTDAGHAAWRWALRHILRRRVQVCVRCVVPSEMDVANNTQLFRLEQLRSCRAEVRVLPRGPTEENEESTNEEVEEEEIIHAGELDGEGGWDIACALVRRGHGFVRQVIDAATPRASNFHNVLLSARERVVTRIEPAPLHVAAELEPQLREKLERFLAAAQCAPALVDVWRAIMWAGDVRRDVRDDPPRTRISRPLRAMISLRDCLRLGLEMNGTITAAALVAARGPSAGPLRGAPRLFLRMSVEVVLPDAVVRDARARLATETGGAISLNPPDGSALRGGATIDVVYDRNMGNLPSETKAYVSACVTVYQAHMYDPLKHRPGTTMCEPLRSVDGGGVVVVTLKPAPPQMTGGTTTTPSSAWDKMDEDALAVVDVNVDFNDDRKPLQLRAHYLISASAQMGGDDASDGEEDFDSKKNNDIDGDRAYRAADANISDDSSDDTEEKYKDEEKRTDSHSSGTAGPPLLSDFVAPTTATVAMYYHTAVDFYFEVNPELRAEHLSAWAEECVHRDVQCIPVGIAEINGYKGFVGDLMLHGRRKSVRSELAIYTWLRDAKDETTEANGSNSWESIPRLLQERLERHNDSGSDNNNNNKSENHGEENRTDKDDGEERCMACDEEEEKEEEEENVLFLTVGSLELWYDNCDADGGGGNEHNGSSGYVPLLSRSFLPPHVPLFALSVFPRQLFYTHYGQHRSLVSKNIRQTANQNAHMDTAFMRLPRRGLPNLFLSNFERLPATLRNVDLAFLNFLCQEDSIRGHTPTHGHDNKTATGSATEAVKDQKGSASDPVDGRAYYASETILSRLLAMLLLLRPRANSFTGGHVHADVYALLNETAYNLTESTLHIDAVLCHAGPSLFLATVSVLSPGVFAAPTCPFPPPMSFLRRALGVLGAESLLEPPPLPLGPGAVVPVAGGRAEFDGCHPLGSRGIGPAPLAGSTPRLYRAMPWLTVIGAPLAAREECDMQRGNGEMVRLSVAVTYMALHVQQGHVYKTFSYGRMRRREIHRAIRSRAQRGAEVTDYFSLLLRRPREGVFADGVLRVYGCAHEPLHIFYQSRRQLRFRMGMLWPGLLATTHDAEERQEEELLTQMTGVARRILDMIAEVSEEARVYLRMRLYMSEQSFQVNTLRISLFKIPTATEVEGKNSADGAEPSISGMDILSHHLPIHELIVQYDSETGKYELRWDDTLERGEPGSPRGGGDSGLT